MRFARRSHTHGWLPAPHLTRHRTRTLIGDTTPAPTTRHAATFGGLDATTVRAAVVAGYGSVVLAAALSPTSANKASMVSRTIDTADCSVLKSSSSPPGPDQWSLLPLSASTASIGSTAGTLLSTLVLCVVTLLWNALMTCRPTR